MKLEQTLIMPSVSTASTKATQMDVMKEYRKITSVCGDCNPIVATNHDCDVTIVRCSYDRADQSTDEHIIFNK